MPSRDRLPDTATKSAWWRAVLAVLAALAGMSFAAPTAGAAEARFGRLRPGRHRLVVSVGRLTAAQVTASVSFGVRG